LWLPANFLIVRGVTSKNIERCMVCGKPIEGKAIRVMKGTLRKGVWRERSQFGSAHETCFAAAVESPRLVLDELRRTVREQGTGSATS
jgi:hypothetical protein